MTKSPLDVKLGRSLVAKRSIVINGHKTSVSLEAQFWEQVKKWAAEENVSIATIVERIDHNRRHGNLSSALRVAVLEHVIGAPRA